MPGIITHHRLFLESIALLKKKRSNYIAKSLDILLGRPEFNSAGLFGALGPNIFDYIPFIKKSPFGSSLSFDLHNGGNRALISAMINRLSAYTDYNNEWAATQRAYFYGMVSHLVADMMFHPYVFFWSGFPEAYHKKQLNKYREQNLLLEYNIDLYFQYHFNPEQYSFAMSDMTAAHKGSPLIVVNKAIKDFILRSLADSFPELAEKVIFRYGVDADTRLSGSIGYIDLVPYLFKIAERLKRTRRERLVKIIDSLRRNQLFFSDFLVRYPAPRRMNKHVINHHRQRWFYPAGGAGLHYESMDDLFKLCTLKTIDIWERIEKCMLERNGGFDPLIDELGINALTGERKSYHDLHIKEPVKLNL